MAAVVVRRPLAPRAQQGQVPNIVSPATAKVRNSSYAPKRARSPDTRHIQATAGEVQVAKRARCTTVMTAATTKMREQEAREKERRRAEREAQKEEFRIKYTKAFPSWVFYFDTTDNEGEELAGRVMQLNARVAKFFSNEVTHFITNKPIPDAEQESNKENTGRTNRASALRSPIKLRGLEQVSTSTCDPLVKKARQLGMKLWETAKLSSVLNRCFVPAPSATVQPEHPTRTLSTLLETERRYGTTTERDPTQKRHDYHYFSKNSYFVLVEDIRQELATIAAHEYPITRTKDGEEKGSWPVPYCHPLARGPFMEYNEREEQRREKQDRIEQEREEERAIELKRLKMRQRQQARKNDLRRSVSMSNLQRQALENELALHDGDSFDQLNIGQSTVAPSGYLGSTATSGYVAASGNSVSVTSNYGTTSTMGLGSSHMGASTLPAPLRERLQNQVVTSRRVSALDRVRNSGVDGGKAPGGSVSLEASASSAMMPPPVDIPDRVRMLKKSKSTNTLRLPKRDEKSKPGYCESCRAKFEDFKAHVRGRKHQKFASNEGNYVQLDYTLARVRRLTAEEGQQAEQELEELRAAQARRNRRVESDTGEQCTEDEEERRQTQAQPETHVDMATDHDTEAGETRNEDEDDEDELDVMDC